jgi:hypothetical protein
MVVGFLRQQGYGCGVGSLVEIASLTSTNVEAPEQSKQTSGRAASRVKSVQESESITRRVNQRAKVKGARRIEGCRGGESRGRNKGRQTQVRTLIMRTSVVDAESRRVNTQGESKEKKREITSVR